MNRAGPILAPALVLIPAALLAVLAFRAAEWDHAEGLAALRSGLEGEARLLARGVESAVDAAARRAAASDVVAYARGGRWLGYAGDSELASETGIKGGRSEPAGAPARDSGSSEVDRVLYELSVRGGESYEIIQGDPERAVDAYSFYLQQIRDAELRARLRFRIARAAVSPTASPALRALAPPILRDLLELPPGVLTEEGFPVSLLAAARLVELSAADREDRIRARGRLALAEPYLATPLLAAFAEALAPPDSALRDPASPTPFPEAALPAPVPRRVDPALAWRIAARTKLEAAVESAPQILGAVDAVLRETFLLVASKESATGLASLIPVGTRSIRLGRFEVPPLPRDRLAATIQFGAAAAGGTHHASAPIRLGDDGPVVAHLVLEDARYAERLAALDRRRTVLRALVGVLALVIAGGSFALARYLRKTRELARLRAKLLRNVSHELRTPVTSIRMLSEMLADDGLGEDQVRKFAGLVKAESRRLGQLFEDFLDASRPDQEAKPLSSEPVDLRGLLRETAAGFAARAAEEGVRFEAEGLGDGDPDATADTHAGAVDRIVANLIDNALKYRRAEGAEVRLSLRVGVEGVAVAVTDNGPGIPREHRERIFEELYRVCYDEYRVKGSGLGLSLARRLARKLGGDVTVESELGRGSTFTLRLPRRLPHAERPNPRGRG